MSQAGKLGSDTAFSLHFSLSSVSEILQDPALACTGQGICLYLL